MGAFKVLKQMGPTAYKLDLSNSATLRIIHPVFYVSLPGNYEGNGLR